MATVSLGAEFMGADGFGIEADGRGEIVESLAHFHFNRDPQTSIIDSLVSSTVTLGKTARRERRRTMGVYRRTDAATYWMSLVIDGTRFAARHGGAGSTVAGEIFAAWQVQLA